MNDWKEVKNWEACKAKGEGIDVEWYSTSTKDWVEQNNSHYSPDTKYHIKTPDPARLLGKVIWTKDGKYAQKLDLFCNGEYHVSPFLKGTDNFLDAEQIESEFDIKD